MEEDPPEGVVDEPPQQPPRGLGQRHAELPHQPAQVHVALGLLGQVGVGSASVLAGEAAEGDGHDAAS
jgi:hypothetical protein